MIKIGSNDINIYVGSAQVDKVYLGNMEVWSNGWGGLGFTAKSADATVSLSNVNGNTPVLEYSTDGITWTSWDYSAISVASGSSVYFRGDNLSGFSKSDAYSCFSLSGTFEAKGNIMSLIDSVNFNSIKDIPNDYCFKQLFISCSGLTKAPKLPATGLTKYCYEGLFRGCSGLLKTPTLPATTVTDSCYKSMFRDCTSLTTTPTLPATTLALNCYRDMFWGCYGLTTAPELPATALTDGCYNSMFLGCTGLTTAPELLAHTLADGSYAYMFYNCSSLNMIKCKATDISAVGCTTNWVQGVAETGDFFPDFNMTGWTTGVDGIPSGWAVKTYTELKSIIINREHNAYFYFPHYTQNVGGWYIKGGATSTGGGTLIGAEIDYDEPSWDETDWRFFNTYGGTFDYGRGRKLGGLQLDSSNLNHTFGRWYIEDSEGVRIYEGNESDSSTIANNKRIGINIADDKTDFGRFEKIKLYDRSGVKIAEYIPVLDGDYIPCFCDIVNSTFVYSSGELPDYETLE